MILQSQSRMVGAATVARRSPFVWLRFDLAFCLLQFTKQDMPKIRNGNEPVCATT